MWHSFWSLWMSVFCALGFALRLMTWEPSWIISRAHTRKYRKNIILHHWSVYRDALTWICMMGRITEMSIYICRNPNDNCCSYRRFYGVVVSTADFESADPGSNPGRTLLSHYITMFFFIYPQRSSSFILSRQLALHTNVSLTAEHWSCSTTQVGHGKSNECYYE